MMCSICRYYIRVQFQALIKNKNAITQVEFKLMCVTVCFYFQILWWKLLFFSSPKIDLIYINVLTIVILLSNVLIQNINFFYRLTECMV